MTTSGQPPGSDVYEFTVAGALGPVLRAALQPHAACSSQESTILRLDHNDDRDIVDVVALLDAKGLDVEEVCTVVDADPES